MVKYSLIALGLTLFQIPVLGEEANTSETSSSQEAKMISQPSLEAAEDLSHPSLETELNSETLEDSLNQIPETYFPQPRSPAEDKKAPLSPQLPAEGKKATVSPQFSPVLSPADSLEEKGEINQGHGFKTECSKNEVYEGEIFSCSFSIVSVEDMVDVEVAKFPEFRGFWSENLALRQGPIPLLSPDESRSAFRKGVIGTYTLIPMIGKPEASIEPMKIVLRKPFSPIQAELIVRSEPAKLKIKPLPPLPSDFNARYFPSAVGKFSLTLETPEVSFRKDEPTVVRVSLQGEGNFPEINEVTLDFPESVEILSQRAYSQGSGQYAMKTFELSVAAHTNDEFSTLETPLFFFDPTTHHYQKLKFPSIRFVKAQSLAAPEPAALEPIPMRNFETTWVKESSLSESMTFWGLNAIAFLVSLWLVLKKLVEDRWRRYQKHPRFQRRVRAEIALVALNQGGLPLFLKLADEIAYEMLLEEAELSRGLSRYQAFLKAQGRIPEAKWRQLHLLCQSHETFAYSKNKTPPLDTEALAQTLIQLTGVRSPRKRSA